MLEGTSVILALLLLPMSASASGNCPVGAQQAGICTTNTGTSVIVGGTQTNPGSGSSGSNPGSGSSGSSTPVYTGSWCELDDAWVVRNMTDCAEVDDDGDDSTPPITIADLARFTPNGSPLTVEPFGIGIVGLPSNFVASSGAHTANGTLFGRDLRVRFTPDLHRFHYGDGDTKTTGTRGRTWAAAGQAQFTPTATSHVYGRRGTYTVRVDVLYTAEVNFGNGWIAVPGHVTARGPSQQIRVYEARTALVAYTCDELPGAPGC